MRTKTVIKLLRVHNFFFFFFLKADLLLQKQPWPGKQNLSALLGQDRNMHFHSRIISISTLAKSDELTNIDVGVNTVVSTQQLFENEWILYSNSTLRLDIESEMTTS